MRYVDDRYKSRYGYAQDDSNVEQHDQLPGQTHAHGEAAPKEAPTTHYDCYYYARTWRSCAEGGTRQMVMR